jgi:hypothetical protein
MTVLAPPLDPAGAAIDAQIAVLQALVNANANPAVQALQLQELNAAQVAAVEHYMVTGWLNAATILATYTAPAWDKVGQTIKTRVAFLQALYTTQLAIPMPLGNANGYGGSGWTTLASAYAQMLYAKQIELVEHLMALPGGTNAATILSAMTGSQTAPAGIPYAYAFSSVGFTDAAIDD